MTSRERFHETFRYGTPDRTYLHQQWLYGTTLERWREEGMPKDVNHVDYFGFDRVQWVRIDKEILPPAPWTEIESGDDWHLTEGAFHLDEYGHRLIAHTIFRELGMWDPASRMCRMFVPT